MKKIGILTYHHGYNFGGFAQVYALQNFLKAFDGVEVEVINYYNKRHLIRKHKFLLSKDIIFSLSNFIKAIRFLFEHAKLNTSKFVTSGGLSKLKYDMLVVGSDEVWNYENPLFGMDLTYFGKNVNTKVKVSYAASFGAASASDRLPTEIKEQLSKFDNISVRDNNSKDIIMQGLNREPDVSIDPTFLISFEEFTNSKAEEEYIVVYFAGSVSESFKDYIVRFSKAKNLKLVSLGYKRNWCDENKVAISPTQWMTYMSKASYVFTTMFHGTIFSVLYKKKFITEITGYRVNKFYPMLSKLGLEARLFKKGMHLDEVDNPIDYDLVERVVKKERDESRRLFEKLLKL